MQPKPIVAEEEVINWKSNYYSRNYMRKEFFKGRGKIFSLSNLIFNIVGLSKKLIVFNRIVEL